MPSVPFAELTKPGWQFLKNFSKVKPKEAKLTVGVDIGSSSLKVVALGPKRPLGGRPVVGHHLVELGDSPESSVVSALKEAMNALHLSLRDVNLAVSGQWVIIRIVEMPALKPAELIQALPFEAQRYLPFSTQDVVLDGAMLGPAEAGKIWVLIVAAKRDLLERRIAWIKQAGLEPAVVDVDTLAAANAFVACTSSKELIGTHALINVGAQLTNLVILKDEVPYLVRDIPWGRVKLLRNVAEQLGSDEAQVLAQLKPGAAPAQPLLDAMKVTTESLTVELQLSFDFFESRFGPPPAELMVSGGVSLCPGFLDALKAHVPQTVKPWAPSGDLSSQFAVAYGLALRS